MKGLPSRSIAIPVQVQAPNVVSLALPGLRLHRNTKLLCDLGLIAQPFPSSCYGDGARMKPNLLSSRLHCRRCLL